MVLYKPCNYLILLSLRTTIHDSRFTFLARDLLLVIDREIMKYLTKIACLSMIIIMAWFTISIRTDGKTSFKIGTWQTPIVSEADGGDTGRDSGGTEFA